ncbi:MAG: NFACT RNA binding domain-containing protein [Oscillospiraceae bacterium]
MALDGAFLHTVKEELQILVNARIDKIYQPAKEEIVISFRAKSANYRLLMSASANSARVHITSETVENPKSPPMFCMLLRKHLGGGKLTNIRQDGLERILYFDFEAMNEIGDMVEITVACEIMGRYSNIILLNYSGKVIDSIKRVDAEMSRERLVLPGISYTFPPRDDKISFLTSDRQEMSEKIKLARNDELSKCLIKAFEGISPLFAREAAFYTTRGKEVYKDDASEDEIDRLLFYLNKTKTEILSKTNKFTVIIDKDNLLKDFCFVDIHQYGNLMVTKEFSTACETLDYFYAERDTVMRMKQRSYDLLKFLANTSDRISRKLALQRETLKTCAERDKLKLFGDLLSANIYRLEKGMASVKLENYYSETNEIVEIKLNKRFTPAQNSQYYYSEYRKSVTAEKKMVELVEIGEKDLEYIDSVFDALTRSGSEDEVLALRFELAEQGYIKSNRLKAKVPKERPPMKFLSSDGFTIFVGRNNKQNDKLTLKTAEKADIWLHVQKMPGSHVIISTNGEIPPDQTIEEAAILAAFNSKGRNSAQVPVDYTLVKFVKKPAGAKPGMVIFTNNKTIYVTPNAELAAKLSENC